MAYRLDDFAFDLRRGVPPGHTWVGSGHTTVRADPATVCGVAGLFAPPYAAADLSFAIALLIDGQLVSDGARPGISGHGLLPAGATWRPDRVVRRGTYHHRGTVPASLRVDSTLTPLYGQAGFALTVSVHNRADTAVAVGLRPTLHPGHPRQVSLGEWGWMPPDIGPDPAKLVSESRWRAGDVNVALDHDRLDGDIAPGDTAQFHFVVQVGEVRPLDGAAAAAEATARWEHRLAAVSRAVPTLHTDVPGLREYWLRCLASGLVCLWDNPAFVTRPFVATSGIDGGALCAYAWDTGGYAPHLLTAMLGETATDLLEAMLAADLTNHYAIAPDGTGLGVAYAYTGWSLVTLAGGVAAQRGVSLDLVARLHDAVIRLEGRFRPVGDLLDYGTQHNLLEMRGTGWEHVVASPNAERASYLDLLADLSAASGAGLPEAALRARAARVRAAVVEELWDDAAGWFRARHPDGHTELVWSVQAFDAMRAGACNNDIASALTEHLRPGAFLGEYGVSSVSAEDDLHYETGDTDWSGAGAYTGEAPLLAMTLWENGRPDLAWDVLRRLLWMGRHFPYYPQEHYCDRPAAPPVHRRANIVAGLAGAEAIVTGLAGLRPHPDGSLDFQPYPPPTGTVELHGLMFRDRTIDVTVAATGCSITVDGRRTDVSPGETVTAIPPRPAAVHTR